MHKHYEQFACCACRATILLPKEAKAWSVQDFQDRVIGWIRTIDAMYCSNACKLKGLPRRVRQPVQAHIRFAPDASHDYKVGAYDAISGFDKCADRQQYRAGYSMGMSVREAAESLIIGFPPRC